MLEKYSTPLRIVLAQVHHDDVPLRFPEIQIVERNNSRPPGEDCYAYVFGTNSILVKRRRLSEVYHTYQRHHSRAAGDFVLYGDDQLEGITHVGKVTLDGNRVISKWGSSHVYSHPPEAVPIFYGDLIGFFRSSHFLNLIFDTSKCILYSESNTYDLS